MYRPALTAGLLSFVLSTAHAFDTAAYCVSVSQAAGGSYSIQASCRDQETAARQIFDTAQLEPRIREYCTSVGEAVGGSYAIALSCTESETASKQKVDAITAAGLDPQIQIYCGQVAEEVGASFSIMEACIRQELEARAQLSR